MRTQTATSELLPTLREKPPQGDPGFEEFFRASWPGAVRLASFLTQDRTAGEEIAQEAFARMYPSWGSALVPEAYLRTTIVNRSANWRRHARVHRAKLQLLAGPTAVEARSDIPAGNPTLDRLADAVTGLPFRQRAVVVLRYHLGLSELEIAEALGCRPGTVKSLASRALARLEKEITR